MDLKNMYTNGKGVEGERESRGREKRRNIWVYIVLAVSGVECY